MGVPLNDGDDDECTINYRTESKLSIQTAKANSQMQAKNWYHIDMIYISQLNSITVSQQVNRLQVPIFIVFKKNIYDVINFIVLLYLATVNRRQAGIVRFLNF